jgi:hypothetical protein
VTLKEKLARSKEVLRIKTEIGNYEQAIKAGSNEVFNNYNAQRVVSLTKELESI